MSELRAWVLPSKEVVWLRRSPEERNRLAVENIPLAIYAWKRFWLRSSWQDHLSWSDGLSIAQETLLNAAGLWDEDRGVKFGTYAYRAIQLELAKELRSMTTGSVRVVSLDAQHGPADIRLLDMLIAPAEPGTPGDERERLYQELASLPEPERQAIEGRYFRGQRLWQIGKEHGCSTERARQLLAQGLQRLRAVYGVQ